MSRFALLDDCDAVANTAQKTAEARRAAHEWQRLSLCTQHTILVIDASGSMREADCRDGDGFVPRIDALLCALLGGFILPQLCQLEEAGTADNELISVVLMQARRQGTLCPAHAHSARASHLAGHRSPAQRWKRYILAHSRAPRRHAARPDQPSHGFERRKTVPPLPRTQDDAVTLLEYAHFSSAAKLPPIHPKSHGNYLPALARLGTLISVLETCREQGVAAGLDVPDRLATSVRADPFPPPPCAHTPPPDRLATSVILR